MCLLVYTTKILYPFLQWTGLSSCVSPVHFIGPVVSLRFTLIYFGLTFQMRIDIFMLTKLILLLILSINIVYGSQIKLLKIDNDYN